jgi:hypothetical protein
VGQLNSEEIKGNDEVNFIRSAVNAAYLKEGHKLLSIKESEDLLYRCWTLFHRRAEWNK